MDVFADYAQYYNLLYADKDYQAEVDYVQNLLNEHAGQGARSILDVGCGTGTHGRMLADRGYDVWGVDQSSKMIEIAKKKAGRKSNLHFLSGDAATFRLNRSFDAIISLFHVLSYQTTDGAVASFLKNIFRHLNNEGIFIFDFWYGPAVLSEKPGVRIKRMEDRNLRLTRIAEPSSDRDRNIVKIDYELFIENKQNGTIDKTHETHAMRYFFRSELKSILRAAGFTATKRLAWMSCDKDVGKTTWAGVIVAKKCRGTLKP